MVFSAAPLHWPPLRSTVPVARSEAACPARAPINVGPTDQVLVAGSNTSELPLAPPALPPEIKPPAINTLPLGSRVAVCE